MNARYLLAGSLCGAVLWLFPSLLEAANFYVDGGWGDNGFDGTTNIVVLGSSHGPKLNISAAIDAAGNGDALRVAQGIYQETNWDDGTKSLTIYPQGRVTIYDSDPWSTDSDGDGIPDAWEARWAAYGFDPFNSNDVNQLSTLPWATNGESNAQAYEQSLTPPMLSYTITPLPNSAGWNTNDVVVHFIPTAGGSTVVSWTPDVTITGETNDCLVVGYATDLAGNTAFAPAIVNIDQTPPTIRLDPGNRDGFDNSYPLLIIAYGDTDGAASSGLNPDSLSVTLSNVDVTTSFYRFGARAILSTNLSLGTYTWTAMISDYAGNSVTSTVTFFATGSANDAAPTVSSLNVTDGMILPDVSEVWVQGKVSGQSSTVSASVNGGNSIAMNRRDGSDDFGYLLPLEPGTNLIVLVASNEGTNQSSRLVSVMRTTAFRAAITSPVFGSFAEGQSNYVTGYVSAKIDEGLDTETNLVSLTVNGATVTLDWDHMDENGNVPFTNDVALPPRPGPVAVTGEITWADGRVTVLPRNYQDDYEVVSREHVQVILQEVDDTIYRYPNSWCGPEVWNALLPQLEATNVFSFGTSDGQTTVDVYQRFRSSQGCTANIVVDPCCSQTLDQQQPGPYWWEDPWGDYEWIDHYEIPPRSQSFGSYEWDEHWFYAGHEWFHFEKTNVVATCAFRAPLHYPTNQVVIFTFEGIEYSRPDGTNLDLSKVKFVFSGKTNDPVNVSNEVESVSYIITVGGGNTNTLSTYSFEWPAYTNYYDWSDEWARETMHSLTWTNFHNHPFVMLDLDNRSKTVADGSWLRNPTRVIANADIKNVRDVEMRINANFDEGNDGGKREDFRQNSQIVTNDPDLVNGRLKLEFAQGTGSLTFAFPTNVTVRAKLGDDFQNITTGQIYTVTAGTNYDLRVEGVAGSASENDVEIKAIFTLSNGGHSFTDTVSATVVETQFMLTFDDGPYSNNTPKILGALLTNYVDGVHVKAAFFLVGKPAQKIWPEPSEEGVVSNTTITCQIESAPNEHFIGNHTEWHADLSGNTAAQVEAMIATNQAIIISVLSHQPQLKLFRPPYLADSQNIRDGARNAQFTIIWGQTFYDWFTPLTLEIGAVEHRTEKYLQHWNTKQQPRQKELPAILILHDSSNPVANHLSELVMYLRNRGYVLVDFDQAKCNQKPGLPYYQITGYGWPSE